MSGSRESDAVEDAHTRRWALAVLTGAAAIVLGGITLALLTGGPQVKLGTIVVPSHAAGPQDAVGAVVAEKLWAHPPLGFPSANAALESQQPQSPVATVSPSTGDPVVLTPSELTADALEYGGKPVWVVGHVVESGNRSGSYNFDTYYVLSDGDGQVYVGLQQPKSSTLVGEYAAILGIVAAVGQAS